MKIAGILLSLLVMLSILPSLGLTFAAPTISIETSQSVYEYGDNLVMIINVSEITGDDARIYITDPAKEKVSSKEASSSISIENVTGSSVITLTASAKVSSSSAKVVITLVRAVCDSVDIVT